MKNPISVRSLIAFLALASFQVYAHIIPGLYNTGTDYTEGQQDLHYLFTVINGTATNNTGYSFVGSNLHFWWLPNDATSKWLTPSADGGVSYDNGAPSDGLYRWVLEFNLDGYDPSTAELTARIMSDDTSIVKLNGNEIASVGYGGFFSWGTEFTISNGFMAGMNRLEFLVNNFINTSGAMNPTGLRVEFTSSSIAMSPVPTPEPGTSYLIGLGIFLIAVIVKRHHRPMSGIARMAGIRALQPVE